MGDTKRHVQKNITQYVYNLKANTLLEYAWFSELRLGLSRFEDRYVLPWKIIINEGDHVDTMG